MTDIPTTPDWSKAKRLGPLQMIREVTTISLLEAVVKGHISQEAVEWVAERMDEFMDALLSGKGIVPNGDGTYAILDRPEGFDPESQNPEVLVIKPGNKEKSK